VDVSRKKICAQVEEEMEGLSVSQERKDEIVDKRLRQEINKGVQTIQYQVVTLMTTNGQAPFITVFMYLNEAKNEREKEDLAMIIEEMIRQRHQGVKNEAGVWITPAFPKLIYVLEEDNIKKGSKYYHLTELAAKCTAKRLVPDYISEKKMLELKVDKNGEGHCYTCMGCRSFLTPYVDENGKAKYYGRFNQGVVTINLVDVALSSGGDVDRFWEIFEERLNLCHKALRARHERLLGTPSDVAPILWQYGALARLKKGEVIDKLLYGGYSTISLGYAGLYECVKYMTGKSHTDDCAKPFALAIMQKMNDKCKEWKEKENIDYSIYGTPLESTTYKFAKSLQKRFGVIEGITDKSYITNSYHVHVGEEIDAFTKLKFESDFQKLSPGGAISYVEVPNMQDNIDAVMSLLQFIYENIMYAELNTKSDYCQCCGYDGEIKIDNDHGKLVWVCPKCGNRDQSKLNVARRTCGYIGTQFWNQGRTQEIKDRVMHLSTLSDISIKGNLSHSSAV
jgi:anaerobic ribonucleoside-triphosphate reductase